MRSLFRLKENICNLLQSLGFSEIRAYRESFHVDMVKNEGLTSTTKSIISLYLENVININL